MKPAAEQLLLADQAQMILTGWNVTEPLPTKKTAVIVGFPPALPFPLARLTRTNLKSTYGKPLYSLAFYRSLEEMQPCLA